VGFLGINYHQLVDLNIKDAREQGVIQRIIQVLTGGMKAAALTRFKDSLCCIIAVVHVFHAYQGAACILDSSSQQ
jgi:hypothetical protein